MASLTEIYEALGALATPEQLEAAASERRVPEPRPTANVHIHLPPNFSAFDDPRQPARLAADEGVRVLGASNFYDHTVYGEFGDEALRRGVFPLLGLELILMDEALAARGVRVNDPQNPGRIYLCGRGAARLDAPSDQARALLGRVRRHDSERMTRMIALINDRFSDAGLPTRLNHAAVVDRVVARHRVPRDAVHVQERHVARSFQEALFGLVAPSERRARLAPILELAPRDVPDDALALQAAIRTRLMKAGRPAYVEEVFLSFDEGRRLILELGAIPCYPIMADGAHPACEFEANPARLIDELHARDIHLVELVPVRNAPSVARRYAIAMREAGLAVTAGTEHNTPDRLPLAPTFAGGQPIEGDLMEILWEGACVVAAHQWLVRAGRAGFVDAEGRANRDYADAEARLDAFRRLGEALLAIYFETKPGEPGGRDGKDPKDEKDL